VELTCEVVGDGPTLGLIHGFTQSARSWRRLAPVLAERAGRRAVAVDAPGHGGSARVDADLWASGAAILETTGPAALLGYSMGGRMALHAALLQPAAVDRLVLVGATAGIADETARAERRAADERLAQRLVSDGLESFLRDWLANPLFAALDEAAADLPSRLVNSADGLASSLRRCGTGTQEPLDDALPRITCPTLLVVGERDAKFRAEAERLAVGLADPAIAVVDDAGHACHLERPDAFIDIVAPFLR
jgi:2-succinyl-6-hydroxy-2,4-cyclohexadiene-1-carboxylate synthase